MSETSLDLRQRTREILLREIGCEPERLIDSARLVEDLGCDSLDIVELVIGLEDGLEVQFTDDEASALRTVGDVHALVQRKAGGRG